MFTLGIPLGNLGLQLRATRLQAIAGFDHVADLRLKAADARIGLIQRALRSMDGIARGVVRLTSGLQGKFPGAQSCRGGLEVVVRGFDFVLGAGLFFVRRSLLEIPERILLGLAVRLQRAVLARDFSLAFELLELGAEFAHDVVDTHQILSGVRQPVFGLAASFLVARDTSGLFKINPKLLGLGLDQAIDHALPDDRVATRSKARAEEQIVHVAPADLLVVDEIAAGAVAREDASHGDLGVGAPLADGTPGVVVEHQLHRGARGGLAMPRAAENHVLHGFAPKLGGACLAHHPAHGINNVGFPATVGTDDPHQLTWCRDYGRINKGLESGEFDLGQTHSGFDWTCDRLPQIITQPTQVSGAKALGRTHGDRGQSLISAPNRPRL